MSQYVHKIDQETMLMIGNGYVYTVLLLYMYNSKIDFNKSSNYI